MAFFYQRKMEGWIGGGCIRYFIYAALNLPK
jgi:hypothetical protein